MITKVFISYSAKLTWPAVSICELVTLGATITFLYIDFESLVRSVPSSIVKQSKYVCEEFFVLEFLELNFCLGAGLTTPASLACLCTPLKANRCR